MRKIAAIILPVSWVLLGQEPVDPQSARLRGASLDAKHPRVGLSPGEFGQRSRARFAYFSLHGRDLISATATGFRVYRPEGQGIRQTGSLPLRMPPGWMVHRDPFPRLNPGGESGHAFTLTQMFILRGGEWKVEFDLPEKIGKFFQHGEPFLLPGGKVLLIGGDRAFLARILNPSEGWRMEKSIPFPRFWPDARVDPSVAEVDGKYVTYFPKTGDLFVLDVAKWSLSEVENQPWDVPLKTRRWGEVTTPWALNLIPIDRHEVLAVYKKSGAGQPVETAFLDLLKVELRPGTILGSSHEWVLPGPEGEWKNLR